MSDYTPEWDLSTIPDPQLQTEVGRRRRSKAPHATYQVLKPCPKCGRPLNATQRRKPCPNCSNVIPVKER